MPTIDWPVRLQPLVEQYGAVMVWRTGIEFLEFPPTWDISQTQLLGLAQQLSESRRASQPSRTKKAGHAQ